MSYNPYMTVGEDKSPFGASGTTLVDNKRGSHYRDDSQVGVPKDVPQELYYPQNNLPLTSPDRHRSGEALVHEDSEGIYIVRVPFNNLSLSAQVCP